MRWLYAAYNIIICMAPVVGMHVWFRRVQLPWRRLVFAWATVSVFWIVLDVVSVARGWWAYNPAYTMGLKLFGLPIEEIAFFVVVPFACSVLLWLLGMYVGGRVHARTAKRILLVSAGVFIFCIAAQLRKERVVVDALLALLTITCLYRSRFITYRLFWYWNMAILGCCLVSNTLLTALPVVIYNESLMMGLRIGTIPIEDFVYNFSLLNMFALVLVGNRSDYMQAFLRARTKPAINPKTTQPPQNQSA